MVNCCSRCNFEDTCDVSLNIEVLSNIDQFYLYILSIPFFVNKYILEHLNARMLSIGGCAQWLSHAGLGNV